MNIKVPSTKKGWAREVRWALGEATAIQESCTGTTDEVSTLDMYKMAPSIAAISRNIASEEIERRLIEESWLSVQYVHRKVPGYKDKYRRCFVHAYLDSMISLKLITRTKAENVIDYLESKGDIEEWKA